MFLLNVVRDESEICSVYAAGADDVDIAVKVARKAFKDPSWRDMSTTDRGNMMIKLSDLVQKHAETLATIETWDNGMIDSLPNLASHCTDDNFLLQASPIRLLSTKIWQKCQVASDTMEAGPTRFMARSLTPRLQSSPTQSESQWAYAVR